MTEHNDLPSGWSRATLSDLIGYDGVFVDGDWVESKDQDPQGNVRLIQLADVGDGLYRDKSARFLTKKRAGELRCTFLNAGDTLVARMPDPLGRACIFPGDAKDAVTVVDVCVIRTGSSKVDHHWLMWMINSPEFRGRVASLQSGSTRKRISRKNLATIELPIAPLSEQARLVDAIDEQFTRLDSGVAALKRVETNLKRYKASVLKAACEGKLTEKWRQENPDVEPASELLKRILKERRSKWEEAELAKMIAKGKPPKNDKWKEKYEEPQKPELDQLPTLPSGWTWLTSDAMLTFVTSGSRGWAKYYADDGPVFIRVGNLDHDSITLDLAKIQRVQPPNGTEGVRTRVEPRDILVSVTADIGMVALVPESIERAFINQHVALTRWVDCIDQKYVAWYLASPIGQRTLGRMQRGVTKAGLGLDDLRNVPIALPPIQEQRQIADVIESHITVADSILAESHNSEKRAISLRQSILKRAFEGKLVEQDAGDEPASVLLERIRASRDGNASGKSRGVRPGRKRRKNSRKSA